MIRKKPNRPKKEESGSECSEENRRLYLNRQFRIGSVPWISLELKMRVLFSKSYFCQKTLMKWARLRPSSTPLEIFINLKKNIFYRN